MLFPIYYLLFRGDTSVGSEAKGSIRRAVIDTIPFAAAAAIFFVARWYVIGRISVPVPDTSTVMESLLSIPSVFLFYIRQSVFPFFLAENYPLRPETNYLSLTFSLSLAAAAVLTFAAWNLYKSGRPIRFGLLLFILPLLPVLWIRSFRSEEIVHDRYLYLPIFGLLIVFGSLVQKACQSRPELKRVFATAAAILTVVLGIQTVLYNRVWASDFSLWGYNVRADPSSAASNANYAAELSSRGLLSDAIAAYDRSIAIKRDPQSLMARSRNLIAVGRVDQAVEDLNSVINLPNDQINAYLLFQTYEVLAIAYSQTGHEADAERTIRAARDRLPIYRAALTDKLAIILYNQKKKENALAELESARGQALAEMLPASKAVLFRIGALEAETHDTVSAKRDLELFLKLSATYSDPESTNLRRQASEMLKRLP